MSRPTCEACGSWKDVHWNDGAQVDLCDRCCEGLRAADKIAELEAALCAARVVTADNPGEPREGGGR